MHNKSRANILMGEFELGSSRAFAETELKTAYLSPKVPLGQVRVFKAPMLVLLKILSGDKRVQRQKRNKDLLDIARLFSAGVERAEDVGVDDKSFEIALEKVPSDTFQELRATVAGWNVRTLGVMRRAQEMAEWEWTELQSRRPRTETAAQRKAARKQFLDDTTGLWESHFSKLLFHFDVRVRTPWQAETTTHLFTSVEEPTIPRPLARQVAVPRLLPGGPSRAVCFSRQIRPHSFGSVQQESRGISLNDGKGRVNECKASPIPEKQILAQRAPRRGCLPLWPRAVLVDLYRCVAATTGGILLRCEGWWL